MSSNIKGYVEMKDEWKRRMVIIIKVLDDYSERKKMMKARFRSK
jgi:hypothetical protein